MDSPIPTSFIPKRPVATEAAPTKTHSRAIGALSIFTVVIMIGTGVAYGMVSLYDKQLQAQKLELQKQIDEERNNIGSDFLSDMKRLNSRIDGVKSLIGTHIVVSPIFAALEQATLRPIQYKSFTYSFVADPTTSKQVVQAALSGVAKSYSTIALQSDAFAQNDIIKNPVFAGLSIDDKTGLVNFKLTFTVDPSDLSYEAFITGADKTSIAPPAATMPTL